HVILSVVFTVLGVIVGLVSLIMVISIFFDEKAMCYPLVKVLTLLSASFFLFSQVFLVISTIRYRRNKDYRMPVIPVAVCIIVGFILYFLSGNLNSLIQERFILPNADKIESIPTGLSEDFSYFDISIWDYETVIRYKMHLKGCDSGRIGDYEGDQEGYEYVIHLDNGDDILISSIDDPLREESMLAGVKYMINSTLTAENTEAPACNSFVSVMSEMFMEPYDQKTSEQINKLNSEHINKLTENEEGSFICKHMAFNYETVDPLGELPDYAIEIVPTPEKDK
ncbi:MAG: hypothetical protein K6G42_03145, partial [Lachnospiraceae bacterium]|nr:hypothetical protein [Lachnospiraceae bacterium]